MVMSAIMPLGVHNWIVQWDLGRPRRRKRLVDVAMLMAIIFSGIGLVMWWKVTPNTGMRIVIVAAMMDMIMHLDKTQRLLIAR